MKVVVIHASGIKASANRLTEELKARGHNAEARNPWREDYRGDASVDLVVSLGCSAKYTTKKRLNTREVVKTCVDKVKTFETFNKAGIPTLEWTTSTEEASKWLCVAVRDVLDGKQGEGLDWWFKTGGEPLRAAPLYTKIYNHRQEYRVVYALGRCWVFNKKLEGEEWSLKMHKDQASFRKMKDVCRKAAVALGADIVGFDVLAKDKKTFVLLEANSGTWLHSEVCKYIARNI